MKIKQTLKSFVNAMLAPAKLQVNHYRAAPALNYDKALKLALDCKPHPFILDIGANEGSTVELIMGQYPDSNLISFEPDPVIFTKLQKLQSVYNFTAFNFALGETNQILNFHVLGNSVSSSLLPSAQIIGVQLPYDDQSQQIVQVPVRRLDDVLVEHGLTQSVDLLKLDVQGYENRVLSGAEQTLVRTRFVLVEANFAPVYEEICMADELCYVLYSAGFRLVNAIGFLPAADTLDLLATDLFFQRKL